MGNVEKVGSLSVRTFFFINKDIKFLEKKKQQKNKSIGYLGCSNF